MCNLCDLDVEPFVFSYLGQDEMGFVAGECKGPILDARTDAGNHVIQSVALLHAAVFDSGL